MVKKVTVKAKRVTVYVQTSDGKSVVVFNEGEAVPRLYSIIIGRKKRSLIVDEARSYLNDRGFDTELYQKEIDDGISEEIAEEFLSLESGLSKSCLKGLTQKKIYPKNLL